MMLWSNTASPALRNALTPVRQAVEAFISLAIAVVIFRGFGVEGYLISTGSMAPTLLGYHHQVTCPSCNFQFSRGAPPPDHSSRTHASGQELGSAANLGTTAHCPNCGLSEFVFSAPRPTEGDQLLVQKHAFDFRDPRRWEVIVFRNPDDPRQAYVKRVAGLPGEAVEIRDGEVFINHTQQRKPWDVQLATRLLVADYTFQPPVNDPERQLRWTTLREQSCWDLQSNVLKFQPDDASASRATDWVEYRHWIQSGGAHVTSIPFPKLPTGLNPDELRFGQLRHEQGELSCTGVFPESERRWWRTQEENSDFLQALDQLTWSSHIAPVDDECDYNLAGADSHPLDDLCLSLTLTDVAATGRFEMQLRHSQSDYRAVLDFASGVIELLAPDSPVPLLVHQLPADWRKAPLQLDLSTADDQLILAVNGKPTAAPELLPETEVVPQRRPARIGASGGGCTVRQLRLYRDLYYTPKREGPAVDQLAADQFFVLGDNSPVSLDSRAWSDPAVPRDALIGKPLVVHLPSRLGELSWSGQRKAVRVPDLSRIRLVH